VLLGRTFEGAGRFAEAEAALAAASRAEPRLAVVQVEHAGFYLRRGEPQRAAQVAEAALGALPGNAALMQLVAEAWRAAGDSERAIGTYEKILALRPQDPLASNNLANLLVEQRGDRRSLERALELTRGFRDARNPALADTLGWVYVKLGRIDEGLPLLRRAAEEAPGAPEIQFHLGFALHGKGDRGAARPYLRRALEAGTDFPGKAQARLLLDS
jgi:tetratricopeptide (TPR) repeat protein